MKIKKYSRSLLGAVVICFALSGPSCGSDYKGRNLNEISKSSNSPSLPEKNARVEICYPGADRQRKSCVPKVTFAQLGAEASKYQYINPFTEPTFPRGFNKDQYRAPTFFGNLTQVDPRLSLSEHFVRSELLPTSSARGHFGVYSKTILEKLEALRAAVGRPVVVNSGYRSPGYNGTLQGAAKFSRHQYGDAVDFAVNGVSFSRLSEICLSLGASYFQIYRSHIHCDWRSTPLDADFYPHAADTTLARAQGSLSVFDAIDEEAKLQLEAAVQGTAGSENSAFLLSMDLPKEDSGELTHSWRILTPSGKVIESQTDQVLVPEESGVFEVQVEVGGAHVFNQRVKR